MPQAKMAKNQRGFKMSWTSESNLFMCMAFDPYKVDRKGTVMFM